MIAEKFGLAELERYAYEVGFKNGDVRTIKGVLAIVGIPNSVIYEAQNAIAVASEKIGGLFRLKETLIKADVEDEAKTKNQVQKLQSERNVRKNVTKAQITNTATGNKAETSEIKRLENILKKFS